MKTFISATDIETLAAQGVRELTVDEDTVLTAVAREAAAQLGVKLVAPGPAATPSRPTARAPSRLQSRQAEGLPAWPAGREPAAQRPRARRARLAARSSTS